MRANSVTVRANHIALLYFGKKARKRQNVIRAYSKTFLRSGSMIEVHDIRRIAKSAVRARDAFEGCDDSLSLMT